MSTEREQWSSRASFVMASVGSAVGLGNVWRFPFVCYENGGGAFLIPYFVALFTTGIPLLIAEYSLGHRTQRSAPEAFKSVNRSFEFLGWTQTVMMLIIVLYYAVVMAWCWVYLWESFTLSWGSDASAHFFKDFLGLTKSPLDLDGVRWPILVGLALTWISIYLIIAKGVHAVGKVVLITVPLPIALMVILVIRGVTLDGAAEGLEFYLAPNFDRLLDPQVWLAAYGQIFFSVGLGLGVMIAYSSYLSKDSDINNNAFITSLANCGTSFLAGFAVFSALGFLATLSGKPVAEVVSSGPGLTFVTYPTIINALPMGATLVGVLFFVMLLTLGIDSAFSIVEGVVAALHDRWGFEKRKLIALTCAAGFFGGIVFTTGAGLYWLDIVDHFLTFIALPVVGLLECALIAWIAGAERFREHANATSDFRIGKWWNVCVGVITPLILGALFLTYLFKRISTPYEGYPMLALVLGGWVVAVGVFVAGVLMMLSSRRQRAAATVEVES